MDGEEREHLAREASALEAGLEQERGRHVAGLEPEPALARLFAARPRVAHRATVQALREAGEGDLAGRVARLRAERAQAEDEEAWRAAESAARGIGPDGAASLHDLELAIPGEPDRERRAALARAAADALGPAMARREAAVEKRVRAAAEVGLAPDWRAVVEGDQLLAVSDDAYRDVLDHRARTALGAVAPGGLTRADLLHVLRLVRWDGLFPAGMLAVALKLTLEPLGLDLGRIRVDDDARPERWPGVHVHGARISLRRRGGAGDWQDLLEAVPRALAAVLPGRRDPALDRALGWLLGSLLAEPRWLADRLGADRRHALDLIRDLALRRLFELRAGAAALRVATEVERGLSGRAWRDAYREALGAATGAIWDGVRAARDAEGSAHAAALAGAAAGERLRRAIRERFDEDWWRNPRAAGFLAALLGDGQPSADSGDGAAPEAADAALALVGRLEGKR